MGYSKPQDTHAFGPKRASRQAWGCGCGVDVPAICNGSLLRGSTSRKETTIGSLQ
ncbi:hypothetical protein BAUCODRAFT_122626 [Baudoinia panamericana UAMH 10762]|uniref:Uncharacterized protein n=1 Tax=Baudoinia panamericana (strain UAMH 10762) TaxID=717646 RepID=M2MYH5_BAUPA|nr:uncharacterized protein BAUCODRAFT_122626 [Baudoinia panamericana UAMH 10762]EMC96643.1 hypothetical protein BAUCODRAFT_122626 [Baudoinia panamericana UAMH 10762]